MRFRSTVLAVIVTLPGAAPAPAQSHDDALRQLSEITGLKLLRKVTHHTMGRDELKVYFEARIQEAVKPEEIRLEELALKKLGFVPKNFDLKKTTIELMTEQAAAFYDYRKKKMVLLDTSQGMLQDLALVHELAHALADQHFRLERFLKQARGSDDGSLARMAVMEGQATWLMSEIMARKMGQSLRASDGTVQMMANMAAAGGSGFPVFESVPLYMRESLVFPYAQGMLFQQRVIAKLGNTGFTEVFRRPPLTTREILHPEVYFEGFKAAEVSLPGLARAGEWKHLTEGTAGEFDHRVLLKQYAKDQEALAAEWRGCQYRISEHKRDKRVVLAYASQWASVEAARKFFAAYRRILSGKLDNAEILEESAERLAGRSADGYFLARLDGATVTSLEGIGALADAR